MNKIINFLKSLKWKKAIGIMSIFLILGIIFFGFSFADDTALSDLSSLAGETQLIDFLNLILKLVYLLVHLCVILAGRLLDNSMVYGEVFHLDAPLRKFRNIMKNFANFILGFLVLLSIIQSIFTVQGHKKPFEIIKQTLIAGILIQASRFLLAAVIDISTIATYTVGGIPLNVMKSTNLGEKKVLSVNGTIDLNDVFEQTDTDQKINDFTIFYTYGNNVIGKCRIDPDQKAIIGVQNFDSINAKMEEKDLKNKIFLDDVCALYGSTVVKFSPLIEFEASAGKGKIDKIGTTTTITQGLYETEVIKAKTTNTSAIDSNKFNTNDKLCSMTTAGNNSLSDGMTIGSLLKKNNGFQGPISALYYSLLDFGSISDISASSGMGDMLGELILKVIIAGALFVPLILLVAVLFVRIGYLWVIIAFSPLYVLKRIKKDFKLPILGDTHDDIGAAMKAIFSPVISVFAISISLIFLSALIGTANNPCEATANIGNKDKMLQAFDITMSETNEGAQEIGILDGMSTISVKMSDNRSMGGVLDMFSWLLINIFGIAIVWTILFAAIKANKLADVISKNLGFDIEKTATNFIKNVPIIPLGGGQRIGIDSLVSTLGNQPQNIATSMNSQSTSNLNDFLNIGTSKDIKYSVGTPNSTAKNVTKFDSSKIDDLLSQLGTAQNESEVKQIFKEQNIKPTNDLGTVISYKDWTNELLNTTEGIQSYLELEDTKQQQLTNLGIAPTDTRIDNTNDIISGLETNNIASNNYEILPIPNSSTVNTDAIKDLKFKNGGTEYQIKYGSGTNGDKYAIFKSSVADKFDTYKTMTASSIGQALLATPVPDLGNTWILCKTDSGTTLIWKQINASGTGFNP